MFDGWIALPPRVGLSWAISTAIFLFSATLNNMLLSHAGQLLRHATLLEASIHKDLSLAVILSTFTRHKNVNLKRASTAAMGELLFYICSQQSQERRRKRQAKGAVEGQSTQPSWHVPRSVWARLLSCLKDKDDKVTRHYACKTLENILLQCLSGPRAAQPSTFEMMLATVEVAR